MFRALLVANRGEIAVRIFRTARRIGIRCIAVHSDADADALHVAMADEAVRLGPAPAAESYLRIDEILAAAKATGAEAIHPGYGFLAENPAFAEACVEAGLVFVGPPAAAMRALGGKAAAKALMQAAGVPLVPGYHGACQDEALLAAEAARLGFPVLIKASAGGGGRGIRVVESAEAFPDRLAAARREAEAAFGDGRVLIEKYLERPRHIEVQVLADAHGTVLALATRDCSIQRRHQKVVEEAPAPGLAEAMSRALADAAVAAARAAGYVNAGTVEFIVEGDRFFFMEMNTRLQVEHPVTEAITGLDLVEWQLRIAAGERLPFASCPPLAGHAIEVRLCAEEPREAWRPTTGRLARLVLPAGEGIRVDSGVRAGDAVTPYYDSLIAKIIAHGASRDEAIARLGAALKETVVEGVATNLDALRAIVAHPGFAAGAPTTGFLAAHGEAILARPPPAPERAVLAAAACLLGAEAAAAGPGGADPWNRRDGWRLFGAARRTLRLCESGRAIALAVEYSAAGWRIAHAGVWHAVSARPLDGEGAWQVRVGDRAFRAFAFSGPDGVTLTLPGEGRWRFAVEDALSPGLGEHAGDDTVASPVPGRVAAVFCSVGDTVARGQVLLIVEAMKTELRIAAPVAGAVVRVACAEGDQVQEGAELVTLAPLEEQEARARAGARE